MTGPGIKGVKRNFPFEWIKKKERRGTQINMKPIADFLKK